MKTTRLRSSPLALALVTGAAVVSSCAAPVGVSGGTTKPGVDSEKLVVQARFEPAVARAGETVRLVLHATTAEGWHAYGSLEETNVPVALDRSKIQFAGLEPAGEPNVPPGEAKEVFGIRMYPLPSVFEVAQAVRVPVGASLGDVTLSGTLDYQICDENSCDAPAEAPFVAMLTVEAGEARTAYVPMPGSQPTQQPTREPIRESANHATRHTIVQDDQQKAIAVARSEDKLLLYNFTGFN